MYLEHKEHELEPHLSKHNRSTRTALLDGLEQKAYAEGGLLLPDLSRAAVVNAFMQWDSDEVIGERESAARFPMRMFKRPAESLGELWHEIRESAQEQTQCQQADADSGSGSDADDTKGSDSRGAAMMVDAG